MNHQYFTSLPASYLHFYNNPTYSALYIIESTHSIMPRQPRVTSGTDIYHVMLRGINRQDIFEDQEDYVRFLACMQQMLEPYDDLGNRLPPLCTFYAYCLMSNHVHLLIKTHHEDIGATIKHLAWQ